MFSTLAYGLDPVLAVLSLAGVAAFGLSPLVLLLLGGSMVVVALSHWRVAVAYPHGAADYRCARENLGHGVGILAGSSLLVELTVAVALSLAAAGAFVAALDPVLLPWKWVLASGGVLVVAGASLMVRAEVKWLRTAAAFTLAGVVLFLGLLGAIRAASGGFAPPVARGAEAGVWGFAAVLVVIRAVAGGAMGLTRLSVLTEVDPTVGARRKRRSQLVAIFVLYGALGAVILTLGLAVGAKGGGPALAEVIKALVGGVPGVGYTLLTLVAVTLAVAAGGALRRFPLIGSVLAGQELLPRQLQNRDDPNSYRSGVLVMAAGAIALLTVLSADLLRLIQLSIVVSCVTLTISQIGMIKFWNGKIRHEAVRRSHLKQHAARVLAMLGCATTALTGAVVFIEGFPGGTWLAPIAIALTFACVRAINLHYLKMHSELQIVDPLQARALPARTHGIVLVSKLHQPTLRAIAFARATRPHTLEALHVARGEDDVAELRQQWDAAYVPVPLTVLASGTSELANPIVEYVRSLRRSSPRDLVVVFVPEYAVKHWWEHGLHNNSVARLKRRLLLMPGAVVTSVPWQLGEADRLEVPGVLAARASDAAWGASDVPRT